MSMSSFMTGLAHPFGGADHILAMVTIGLWGVLAGGRALWVWPMAFVAAVLAGYAAGIVGLQVLLVEPAIAASLVGLGLLVALAVQASVWSGAAIASAFAFFHGHAHGTEAVAAGVVPLPYAVGFSLATAILHGAGIAVGFLIARPAGGFLLRATGGLVAMGGVALMAALA